MRRCSFLLFLCVHVAWCLLEEDHLPIPNLSTALNELPSSGTVFTPADLAVLQELRPALSAAPALVSPDPVFPNPILSSEAERQRGLLDLRRERVWLLDREKERDEQRRVERENELQRQREETRKQEFLLKREKELEQERAKIRRADEDRDWAEKVKRKEREYALVTDEYGNPVMPSLGESEARAVQAQPPAPTYAIPAEGFKVLAELQNELFQLKTQLDESENQERRNNKQNDAYMRKRVASASIPTLTAAETEAWLEAQGFQSVVPKLKGFTGAHLFKLTQKQLEDALSLQGIRIYKVLHGNKTASTNSRSTTPTASPQ